MLFEIVFQSVNFLPDAGQGCDLMLFEIVFQSQRLTAWAIWSCDLMLFEIVFQSASKRHRRHEVVI